MANGNRALSSARLGAIGILVVIVVAGCTWQVRMMPRDTGKVYLGSGKGDGFGGGTITMPIDGKIYTGPVMRVSSSDSFGFFQAFGSHGASVSGVTQSFGGTINVKAILSSSDDSGLRCDFTGDGAGHLGGICVDDRSRVYDVLANR